MLKETVDDAGAVEAGHDREPTRDSGRLVAADLLHPAEEQLDMGALSHQRLKALPAAPGEEGTQI